MSSIIDRVADYAAEPLFKSFGFGIRMMGPLFVIGFYVLMALHVYAYFGVVLFVLKKRLGTIFGLLWVAIGLVIVYNVAFNHFFATFIKPGSPSDLKKVETIRKELKQREGRRGMQTVEKNGKIQYVEDDRFEGLSKEVKKLMRYRGKTISSLEPSWQKKCSSCKYIKPTRTHHCSVCNSCVFLMDHHCPWVNNCLGLENYRYFLLFILYLLMGVVYNLITIVSIWNHHIYKQNTSMMTFVTILDGALSIVLIGFNGWNWFLAMTGLTTIEFWGQATRSDQKYDYNFKSIQDNLYRIFGTHNFIAMLSPSLRSLPFTGVEWSYQMRDLGYNERGQLEGNIFDEEDGQNLNREQKREEELTEIQTHNSNHGNSNGKLIHKTKIQDSTLDSLDKEIEI